MAIGIRRAGGGDDGRILELMAELMPGTDVARRHAWLYRENPDGDASTVLAVDDDSGATAGMCSVFPRRVRAAGREVRSALGGDDFVRPGYRRRGIGTALHRAAGAAMRERGIEFVHGTPLPANGTPLRNVGARDVERLIRHVRPLLAARAGIGTEVARNLLMPWLHFSSQIRLEPIDGDDRRVDEVWERCADPAGIAVVRDARFYGWRFARSPSGRQRGFVAVDRGRPFAAVALERCGRRLRIIDWVAPRHRFAELLHAVLRESAGAVALELRATGTEAARLALWRFGFFARESLPWNVTIPAGTRDAALYADGGRWFATWADSDVDATS